MKRADFWGGSVPWVSPKDMKAAEIVDSQDHITETALRETSIPLLDPPAVLLVIRGMILARRVPIAVTRVPVTINQDMKALLPRGDVDARYLRYALEAAKDALAEMIDEAGHGTKRLPMVRWRQLELWMPPLAEQKAIADYLDANAVQVARFIRNRRRLIEVLNEQKQAIIHRAVTGGLDPNAPRKPSGIDWLGDIPEHWEVLSLKRVLRRLIDCEHKTAPAVDESDFHVIRTSAVRNGQIRWEGTYCTTAEAFTEWTQRGRPEPGDVVFTREAPAGEACVVPEGRAVCLGQRTVLMKLRRNEYDAQFLVYMIYGGPPHDRIRLTTQGSTVGHFNMDDIGWMPVLEPPLDEQERIVAALQEETGDLDAAVSCAEREIGLVREYRTRLIADVVTGMVNVRDVPLDDELAKVGGEAWLDDLDSEANQSDDECELIEEAES